MSCTGLSRELGGPGTVHTMTTTGNAGPVSVFIPYRHIVNDGRGLAKCNNKLTTGGVLLRLRTNVGCLLWRSLSVTRMSGVTVLSNEFHVVRLGLMASFVG